MDLTGLLTAVQTGNTAPWRVLQDASWLAAAPSCYFRFGQNCQSMVRLSGTLGDSLTNPPNPGYSLIYPCPSLREQVIWLIWRNVNTHTHFVAQMIWLSSFSSSRCSGMHPRCLDHAEYSWTTFPPSLGLVFESPMLTRK